MRPLTPAVEKASVTARLFSVDIRGPAATVLTVRRVGVSVTGNGQVQNFPVHLVLAFYVHDRNESLRLDFVAIEVDAERHDALQTPYGGKRWKGSCAYLMSLIS